MRTRLWRLEMAAGDPTALNLFIYGYVQPGGYNWLTGEEEVSETSADFFRDELAKYPTVGQINVYINSYGGSVYEAIAMRNQLKRHPAHVTGYVDGFAASAASFILTACDTVNMYSNTMQMLHNMVGVSIGNANAHRKAADDQDAMMSGIRQAYLEKSGGKMTEEQLTEVLDNETWLNAQQCLEYGLCDEIIAETVDLTAARSMMEKANMTLEQHLKHHMQLSEQLRAMTARPPDPAPVPPAPPEPQPRTNAEKLMAAFKKPQQEE